MTIISWKAIYATGIIALDDEHRQLIEQINRLYEAIRDKQEETALNESLEMLESYTLTHFQHEEKLMAEYGFPGLSEHKNKHQELINIVQDLKKRASSDADGLAQELLRLLRTWVLEHILDVDKQYGPFLESRGGRFIS